MRDASLAILRKIGVETGGSNVQFAVHPQTGRMIVIEMNPRVSRSECACQQGDRAFRSPRLPPSSPSVPARRDPKRHHPRDPCLLRANDRLCGDENPAVGVREIPGGRPDADHPDEVGRRGDGDRPNVQGVASESAAGVGNRAASVWAATARTCGVHPANRSFTRSRATWRLPTRNELWWIRYALLAGLGVDQIHALTNIDPWFLANIEELDRARGTAASGVERRGCRRRAFAGGEAERLFRRQLATLWNTTESEVRRDCRRRGIRPVFKLVDTCAAEFAAVTPYYYSTYESEDEASAPAIGRAS